MKGWISIHRKLRGNWLWTEKRKFSRAEAWIDLLLTVNHEQAEVSIKGQIFTVKRGESLASYGTFSDRWGWSISSAKRFFETLQSRNMIRFKSETVSTRITICNYDSYQSGELRNETQMKRTRNAQETHVVTNNKKNNNNNENKKRLDGSFMTQKEIDMQNKIDQFLAQ